MIDLIIYYHQPINVTKTDKRENQNDFKNKKTLEKAKKSLIKRYFLCNIDNVMLSFIFNFCKKSRNIRDVINMIFIDFGV